MDKATFIDIMGAVTGCLHEDAAFRFPQPVLLLCGADDNSGNIRASMTAWAQADENRTLFMIEDAGHNANQDQPEAVNQHILDFLWLLENLSTGAWTSPSQEARGRRFKSCQPD